MYTLNLTNLDTNTILFEEETEKYIFFEIFDKYFLIKIGKQTKAYGGKILYELYKTNKDALNLKASTIEKYISDGKISFVRTYIQDSGEFITFIVINPEDLSKNRFQLTVIRN